MANEFKAKKTTFKSNFGVKKVAQLVEYTSETPNLESDCNDEMNFLDKEFGKAKQKEINSFNEQTESSFYISVYFKTNAQKEQFIQAAKIESMIDDTKRFIKGENLADHLGINIDKVEIKTKGFFKAGTKFSNEEWFND